MAELVKTMKNEVAWDVQKIRADFPILRTEMHGKPLVFLDSAASSQKPQVVIDALSNYYATQHANVHRGVYELSAAATDKFEEARSTVQRFINAEHDHEVVFVRGTTEAINLVAHSFGRKYLQPGDEVMITAMEHHSNIVPWQLVCQMYGAKLVVIPINEAGEINLETVKELMNDRTKLISIVHISNALGTINPIRDIVDMAHQADIPVLADGAQATAHGKVDVRDLDVDFLAFSGHKMFGPTGIGILYGKEKWLEELPPYQGGGEMIRKVTFEETTYNELPFKFEAGTPNIAGSIGLKAAIDYLDNISVEGMQSHEEKLLESATTQLLEIPGVKIIGTAEEKASLVSFVVEGIHPYDIGTLLDHQGIAVRTGHHCAEPLMDIFGITGTIRASFALYNTLEEIDKLVAGVQKAVKMLS